MRLRMGICILAFSELAGCRINVEMALCRPCYAICPVEPCVEPLWRIGRSHLVQKHEYQFIIECLRILLAAEIIVLLSPGAPASCKPVHYLPHAEFRAIYLLPELVKQGFPVLVILGHPCLPEVFLGNYIGGNLAP